MHKNNFWSSIKTSQERFSVTYFDGRFISEGGRLISDVLQTNDVLKLSDILVTLDIQKAFDSVTHQFLTLALKRYGFGQTFKREKTLLNNQESCIINGGFILN